MRKIKFRGETPKGAVIYGDLTHCNEHTYIDDYRVKPESVQQLLGYDKNGDEVYEGDEVLAYEKKYPVKFVPKYGLFHELKYCEKVNK